VYVYGDLAASKGHTVAEGTVSRGVRRNHACLRQIVCDGRDSRGAGGGGTHDSTIIVYI
jgi:hypothetical protein